jgi:hypothetical protein
VTQSGAWIQSEDRTPALFLDDGAVVPAEREAERQEIVKQISRVTSDGRRTTWGDGVTAYLVDGRDGMYDVVFEAPRPGAVDALGRGVMSSLVLRSVTAADAAERLAAFRQTVVDRGIPLAPLPEDIASQLAGLIASGRRGCLPLRRVRQLNQEV